LSDNIAKRLNKYISDSGVCSRREADKYIEEGRVKVNGQPPELGTKVTASDRIELDGKLIKTSAEDKSDRLYIAYNKPVGITCTTERHVRGNIIDAIKHEQRIFPIGRLDKPSEGLILLTNDGDIVNKILRAENAHDKEYVVRVDKPINDRFIQRMGSGIPILGTKTKPCVVKYKSKFVFSIILTEGLNRQIRRMCEYLGYEVESLVRKRIMHIDLKGLAKGHWRYLTEAEMTIFNKTLKGSSKTAKEGIVKRTTSSPKGKGKQIKITPQDKGEAYAKPSRRGETKKSPWG
jgi:pseudouridine synthase